MLNLTKRAQNDGRFNLQQAVPVHMQHMGTQRAGRRTAKSIIELALLIKQQVRQTND